MNHGQPRALNKRWSGSGKTTPFEQRRAATGLASPCAAGQSTRAHPMRGLRFTRVADKGIGRIEAATSLDRPAYAVETAIARPAQIAGRPANQVGDVLHGTGYGHPVHPMLVTIPIGTWTLALGLDLLAILGLVRKSGVARVADVALKAGAVSAVAAAATGLADWQHT